MELDWTAPEPLANAYGLPTDPGASPIWDLEGLDSLESSGQSGNLKSRLYRHRQNRDETLVFRYALVDGGNEKRRFEQTETNLIGVHR